MKAVKLEVLVVDFDGLGEDGVARTIRDTRYPNHCISPLVLNTQVADLGEWDDSHPLNQGMKAAAAEVKRLFPTAVDTIEHDPATLRPCPFCGGEAAMRDDEFGTYVGCLSCKARGPKRYQDELARSEWNRRAP